MPGAVEGLSAVAPVGSDTMLTVSWSVPAESIGVISQYYVTVTNYSLAPATNMTVPGDKTSTIVTGLRKTNMHELGQTPNSMAKFKFH